MSQHDLSGRNALVTGGASGIGKAAAIRLVEHGAQVVVADVDDVNGERVAAELGARYVHLDVSSADEWASVVEQQGPFDIAFLNAGTSTKVERRPDVLPLLSVDDDAYNRIMSINVDGVVFGARAVLPAMVEQGSGDIIATSSMAGLSPMAQDPIYGLTKHAVVGFIRSMAASAEQLPVDICFSAICPGFADTGIIGGGTKELLLALDVPILDPLDVGDVVVRSLIERRQGAQWVVWEGLETSVYEWNPAIDPSEHTPLNRGSNPQ